MKFKWAIGAVLLMIALLSIGCGGGSGTPKPEKEDSIQGMWYSTKKDKSSGVISSISLLEIKDSKSAHLTKWDLKGNTFSGSNGKYTKILWQSTDLDLAISKSGNKLEFTVPDVNEMGTVLECEYNSDKQTLKSKDGDSVFSSKEIPVQKLKEENIKAYQEFAAKQGVTVELEKDMTSGEYLEYVKKNSFEN